MAHLNLPDGFVRAPATFDLVDEVADLMMRVWRTQSGRPLASRNEIVSHWDAPMFDPQRDLALVRAPSGELVAVETVLIPAPHVQATAIGVVAPEYCGHGIGSALLEWAEKRVHEQAVFAPAGTRIAMQVSVDGGHAPSMGLLAQSGFAQVRHFLSMGMTFTSAPPAQALPAHLELRPFTLDLAESAFHAMNDAFRDHFGFVEGSDDEEMQRFLHWVNEPTFDPTLLYHVYDGDEIAANCWCLGDHGGDETIGYIANISVRRAWRGQGLARALLLRVFGDLYRRGKRGVALLVDAESLTGATRLYESVGMRVERRDVVHEKELRSGEDIVRRGLEAD